MLRIATAFKCNTRVLVPPQPLALLESGRKSYFLGRKYHATPSILETCQAYKSAASRYYARWILDAAAASAAITKAKCETTTRVVVDIPTAWKDYNPHDWSTDLQKSMGSTWWHRFYQSSKRICTLSLLASPFLWLYPLSCISQRAQNLSWNYALWAIEQSGPTFIKLVQWATTRQDLFSPEFCAHFGKLRDETRGHKWKDTHKLLQESLGKDYENALEFPSKQPIGSGCIAQVYQAKLVKDVGIYPSKTELAVKVQHPGIWNVVCVDFYILAKVARFLESLPKLNLDYLSIEDSVHQFLNVMLPQLDLRMESKNLERFNREFQNDPKVEFPRPLQELTSQQVLVETFMHGTPIMEFTQAPSEIRHELARLGLSTVLKMIFLNDFVHGDLHPGNILVLPNQRLGLLDCGLVIEMGPEQHVNLVKVLGAFVRRDGTTAGHLMVDTASKCQASELDVELFVEGIEKICIMDQDNNFLEKVGDYIADICFLACKHKVKLEASFINAALAVEIMEGIASALYPDLKCQQMALPMVIKAEMMHRMPSFSVSGWG